MTSVPRHTDADFTDDLRRDVTAPDHDPGFMERLSVELYREDDRLGRDSLRGRGRRRVPLMVAAALALVAVAFVVVLGGLSSEPTAADMHAIRAAIARWEDVEFLPWPAEYYALGRLPERVHEAMMAQRLEVARQVGTEEFVSSYPVTRDQAGTLEEFKKAGEGMCVRSMHRVIDVRFIRAELNGDILVEATVWGGEVTGRWDPERRRLVGFDDEQPARFNKVDTTPVYAYTIRQSDGRWRLVSKDLVVQSEDDSGAFGPNTPHSQRRLHD